MSGYLHRALTVAYALIGIAFLSIAIFTPLAASGQQPGRITVIKNVRVFDGMTVIPETTVVVEGGKIKTLGRTIDSLEGVEVIDGSGQTLLPGLIDSHTHVFGPVLKQALMFGVTTELDMFTDHRMAAQLRKEQAEGKATDRADMLSAGVLVTVPGGHGSEYGIKIPTITRPDEAQAFVDARINEGSDYIKIVYDDGKSYGLSLPSVSKETMKAVITAAHKREKLAVVHIVSQIAARDAIESGADGLVHIFSDRLPDPDFGSLVAARHAFIIPTLSVVTSLSGATNGESLITETAFANALSDLDALNLKKGFPVRPGTHLSYANAEQAVRQLKAAGVPILAGTDAPNPGTLHGVSIHRELELLVRAGLTPVEALAAATSTPAAKFKLSDRGRILPGMHADLLLVKGDPTSDIKATRNILRVWKRGAAVDRTAYIASIEKLKAEAASRRSEPAPAGSESGLVSDFEEEKLSAKFGFGWSATTDAMANGKSVAEIKLVPGGANNGRGSLSIIGDIHPAVPYAWAGAMFSPGPGLMAPVNLSSKKEIIFWAKGDGQTYRLMLFSRSRGYQPATKIFVAGPEWKQFTFRISDFDGMDGSNLMGILFVGGPSPGKFSFQVDDVRLD